MKRMFLESNLINTLTKKAKEWRSLIFHFYETTKHKFWVAWYIVKACWTLLKRAFVHDFSKYQSPEREGFSDLLGQLRSTTYGSKEYHELLRKLKPTLTKHYQNNRHHPQYYHDKNGYARMSPLDKLEMICDWKAATLRHDDGDLNESIKVNKDRFNYNEFDRRALLRDAKEIGLL